MKTGYLVLAIMIVLTLMLVACDGDGTPFGERPDDGHEFDPPVYDPPADDPAPPPPPAPTPPDDNDDVLMPPPPPIFD